MKNYFKKILELEFRGACHLVWRKWWQRGITFVCVVYQIQLFLWLKRCQRSCGHLNAPSLSHMSLPRVWESVLRPLSQVCLHRTSKNAAGSTTLFTALLCETQEPEIPNTLRRVPQLLSSGRAFHWMKFYSLMASVWVPISWTSKPKDGGRKQ